VAKGNLVAHRILEATLVRSLDATLTLPERQPLCAKEAQRDRIGRKAHGPRDLRAGYAAVEFPIDEVRHADRGNADRRRQR
jgi:hypothetical protein